MTKKIISIFLLSFFATVAVAAEKLPPLPQGPLILTSATRAMQSPEFWISKIPGAEKTVKTPEEVAKFNDYIRSFVKENVDIFKLDSVRPGKQITDQLTLEYETLKNRKLFGVDDKYIPKSFFEEQIKPLVQIDKVPSRISMKWGAAVRATSVRAIPTMVKMLEEKKISAAEAMELIDALGKNSSEGGVRRGRALRIRVYEGGGAEPSVNINIPLDWAKFMAPFIESKIKAKLANKGYDVDLGKIQEAIDGQAPMRIVDVQDGGDKVEIFIE